MKCVSASGRSPRAQLPAKRFQLILIVCMALGNALKSMEPSSALVETSKSSSVVGSTDGSSVPQSDAFETWKKRTSEGMKAKGNCCSLNSR